ncbi:MAG: right-handed parallel beta-helix repeat-containing protein [Candidatus Hydrogenedentes bacterium]|nr:right-handed parallel beta-helix repeat-containing protein [Candidatus Hydrogenedentota bacterium]
MRFVVVIGSLLSMGLLPAYAQVPRNDAAIQEVAEGKRDTANAAWWGFSTEDATEALQSAIDSKAARVVVPFMGADWIVRPIRLRGNLELCFEPGVVVMAKKDEFQGPGDSLFSGDALENLKISGYGATLRMRKQDYAAAPYKKGEWRMVIDLGGCRNVTIEGMRLESSGGDGIYVGAGGGDKPYCENVTIRNVVCHDNYRQGISVISAKDLLIENCTMSGTGGTAPEAGIDFEPNAPNERLENCVVRNCQFADNEGAGILVYLKPLDKTSAPVSLLFENCHVRGGNDAGIGIGAIKEDGPGGTVEFRNCTVENSQKCGAFIYDKAAGSALVRFVNCTWNNVGMGKRSGESGPFPPLLISQMYKGTAPQLGGIAFEECSVFDAVDRPVLEVEEAKGDQGIANLTGTIALFGPHEPRITVVNPVESLQVISGSSRPRP